MEHTAWTLIGDTAIFLDIRHDRYFRLPPAGNAQFVSALEIPAGGWPVQPPGFERPGTWAPPASRSPLIDSGPFNLGDVARAIWMQKRVERRLNSRPFMTVMSDLAGLSASKPLADPSSDAMAARMVRAFELARLLRSAADRCLARSIALALCLMRRRCAVQVVLGVKLSPFSAHCWVQSGEHVLNDSLEEVQRYSPILVL
ncbi:lasso peptide biosynthesis B2 protein [Novosphingobium aquae]|uniref:Lasso peptide biosynthesis B2 protein n=1 Tax=Novosphingobium aquae TaxID=3133435 RepID=A0ABU8S9Y7_9SPHN